MGETTDGNAIVYVGTYTQTLPHVVGKAEGIYVYHLDRATGALHYLSAAPGVANPSFLVVEPARRYLYAVQEVGEYGRQRGGAVSAFAIDARTYALVPINHQRTGGTYPCHVGVDHTGRWLLVANHGGGISILPIQENGALGAPTVVMDHLGSRPQGTSHPHAILPDPGNRFVLVADCGLSRIAIYRFDPERGTLVENDTPRTMLPPGTGPRHLAFHPSGAYLYCINESGSSITAFAYDAAQGALGTIQTISTTPEGYVGKNYCADIHCDPSGQFVYGSNRGHDSIAAFTVDTATGMLRPLGHVPTSGRTPRGLGIDPSGTWLLAANQDADTIVSFSINQATGNLTPAGPSTTVPTPVCVRIVDIL